MTTPARPPLPEYSTANRILIVEDEAITASDLRNRLTAKGYDVVGIASTGAEALVQVATAHPHLVLMDIRLRGGMDGVEAATLIHERFQLPVVFLTAHSDEVTLERAKHAEPFGYVLKPFEERELQIVLDMAIYKHTMERERELLIHQLREALAHVKTLTGLFPICASCKKIRNDEGYWEKVEAYLTAHTDAHFSHGICPECFASEMAKLPPPSD
ncbi:MAG: response regulator [Lentisphaerae bacterium]|nr:response regulator [Lentisphaerota bacterium]